MQKGLQHTRLKYNRQHAQTTTARAASCLAMGCMQRPFPRCAPWPGKLPEKLRPQSAHILAVPSLNLNSIPVEAVKSPGDKEPSLPGFGRRGPFPFSKSEGVELRLHPFSPACPAPLSSGGRRHLLSAFATRARAAFSAACVRGFAP